MALANILKTSFGPTGLDKMLIDGSGSSLVTNDGATILGQLAVELPAAKLLVELAQLQDKEVGDGTTSVVILASELLKVSVKPHRMLIIQSFSHSTREETLSFLRRFTHLRSLLGSALL